MGAQRYESHRLFATARYGGALYVGAAAAWVRVPDAVRALTAAAADAGSARADAQLYCAVCVAVWLLGWRGGLVRREWMWRHFTASPPATALVAERPHTVFTSVVSHASLSALACQLALFAAVAPNAQDVLGRGRAAALFLMGGAAANVFGVAGHAVAFSQDGKGSGSGGDGGDGGGGGGGGLYGHTVRRGTGWERAPGGYVPPPWASPCYASGAGGGCCALLGYLARAAAAAATARNRSGIGDLFSFFGGGADAQGAYGLFGVRLTAAQLLFAVLGSQIMGLGALGGGGGGAADVGLWVSAAGAGLGWAVHQFT